MIYVTHDQIEAMTLADRIAIMRDGIIQQLDTPHVIYNNPVNLFVAGFIGSPSMNFINGDLKAKAFNADGIPFNIERYEFASGNENLETRAVFGIRPEHIIVGEEAASQPVNFEAEIEIVEPMGSDTIAWTKLGKHEFTFRADSELNLGVGQKIRLGFDPARASIFHADSGDRI